MNPPPPDSDLISTALPPGTGPAAVTAGDVDTVPLLKPPHLICSSSAQLCEMRRASSSRSRHQREKDETISSLEEAEGKLRAEVKSLRVELTASHRRETELLKTVEELERKLREQLDSIEEEKWKSYKKGVRRTLDRFEMEFGKWEAGNPPSD